MKKIWSYFGKYKRDVKLCFIATLFETIFFLLIPKFISKILNTGLVNQDKDYIYKMGGLMILCAILAMIIGIYENHLSAVAGQGLGSNLRKNLFGKIVDGSAGNIDKFTSSSLITRLNSDVSAVQTGAIQFMRMIFVGGWRMIIAFILAVQIDAKLSIIIVGSVVAFLVFLAIAFGLILPHFSALQKEMDTLNTRTQDNTRAQGVVKSFVRQKFEEEKFETPNSKLSIILTKANGIAMSIVPLSAIVMNVSIAAILWFGGKQTGDGTLGFGDLVTFLSYTMQVCAAIGMVAVCAGQLGKAKTALGRILEVINAKDEIVNPDESAVSFPTSGDIKFENTTFQYVKGSPKPTLSEINLHIPTGQFLAVIGSTGEGKSSLINLIPRFYDTSSGNVYIDNHNVKEYDLNSLRKEIGLVPQKSTLFSGTIIENLKFGKPNASLDEVINVCKLAQAHDFIMSFEKGYDSWVEQGGVNLSGGQRQRLCIARALLKNPRILLLDDSTSALDRTTEENVQKAFKENYKDTTIILIAQKISSVMNADAILVLDEGKISGLGTHSELLENNKIYQEIYNSQVKEVA